MVSEEELDRIKATLVSAAPSVKSAGATVKTWRTVHFSTVSDAVSFANRAPAQQAGEFGVTDNPAGGVDGYYFF